MINSYETKSLTTPTNYGYDLQKLKNKCIDTLHKAKNNRELIENVAKVLNIPKVSRTNS